MGFLGVLARAIEVILWILAVVITYEVFIWIGPPYNLAFLRESFPLLVFYIPPFFIHRSLDRSIDRSNSRDPLKSVLLPILIGYIIVIVLVLAME
ncbi:MAG: hypothetical protein IH840_01830 [Candidatus Heimdallarchaeota archaeon]|nr:hypothetical protein [Candidatus Heimdallarchaeota archaeon]